LKTFRFVYEQRPECDDDVEFSKEYGFATCKDTTTQVNFGDDITWMAVMDEFVSFLGSVYGYDIHGDIEYKDFEAKFKELCGSRDED
jgi:hypothetical protein